MTCPYCQSTIVQREEATAKVVPLYSCDDCGTIWRGRSASRRRVVFSVKDMVVSEPLEEAD